MNKKAFTTKLLKICFVYAFALISVVACGEGFKSQSIQRPKLRSMGAEPPGSFQPVITGLQKLDMREQSGDLSYQLNYSFTDGSQVVNNITTYHRNGSDFYQGVEIGGRLEYGIDAVCIIADCSRVVGTIVRVDKQRLTASQSTFVLDETPQGYQIRVLDHNTYYETSMDAWEDVWHRVY